MSTPRIAAVHDLSCFGRCALTIVMPTLSVMGVQCCPVPTALLSTHTGGFTGNTFLDLSDEMAAITAHWQSLGLGFQGIYTGFLGSMRQIGLTENLIQAFRREGTVVVIDPVMGDHGRPYRTYTPELCRGVRDLSRLADVVVPNRTEAAILLERDYGEITLEREEDCCRWARALSMGGRRSVVLTGIALEGDRTGAACFDRATGHTEIVTAPHVAGDFHGTGDLFASVLTGALVRGMDLVDAAALAAEFTALCARRTAGQDYPRREGVDFEPLLWRLGQALAEGERAAEEPRRDMGSAGPEPGKGEPL